MTCSEEPPVGTILFAQECPDYGGDTLWAGICPALEALSGGLREFVTRLRWEAGSIALWDNRQVWHLAVNDYHGMRRVMNRILLVGAKPIPAA
jgi:alpha-ketoglutarate-dependent taurine dioxygenase